MQCMQLFLVTIFKGLCKAIVLIFMLLVSFYPFKNYNVSDVSEGGVLNCLYK